MLYGNRFLLISIWVVENLNFLIDIIDMDNIVIYNFGISMSIKKNIFDDKFYRPIQFSQNMPFFDFFFEISLRSFWWYIMLSGNREFNRTIVAMLI